MGNSKGIVIILEIGTISSLIIKGDEIMKWTKVKIKNKDTYYIISEKGDVINTKTGNKLKPYLSDGYLRIRLNVGDDQFSPNLARILLNSFNNKDYNPTEYILYFKDNDITNISLENVEYLTYNEFIKKNIINVFNKQGDYYILSNNNKYKDELWSQIFINNHISKYFVSNHGRILNIITNMYLKPTIPNSKAVYPYLTLRDKGKSYRFDIHRLVAIYFVKNDNPTINDIVHHKDENKHNFYYKNLEWTTSSGNSLYSVITGTCTRGEEAKSAKINEDTAKKICIMLSEGYRICEIQNTLKVSRNIIRHIKDGNTWKHISKDYDIGNYKNIKLSINDINVVLSLFENSKTYK
jgi:hypothetical protein